MTSRIVLASIFCIIGLTFSFESHACIGRCLDRVRQACSYLLDYNSKQGLQKNSCINDGKTQALRAASLPELDKKTYKVDGPQTQQPLAIEKKWFPLYRQISESKLRFFCFHFAGSSAQIFQKWQNALSPFMEVCAIQLPGRGGRIHEARFTRLEPLITSTFEAISPLLQDKPYALFGHSFGGLIAYELAQHIRKSGQNLPVHLFVSGFPAPHLAKSKESISNLDDDGLIRALNQKYNQDALPTVIIADPQMKKYLVGLLRSDFEVIENYRFIPKEPLDIPLTTLRGTDDPVVSAKSIEAWKDYTTQSFTVHTMPGNHLYMKEHEKSLLDSVKLDLESSQGSF